MVNKEPGRLHMPVAPRYLTKLEYGFSGTINQALAAGTASYWSIHGGTGLHCGNTANTFTAVTGSGVLYPATLAINALSATGFTQLSVLYARVRVHMSRIVLSLTPPTKAFVVVYPSNEDVPVTDFQSALAQPFSKEYELSQYNNVKQNTIMMTHKSHEILGLTKRQFMDSDNTAALVTATHPNNQVYWNIIVQPDAAATSLVGTTVNLRMTYWAEFFDPLPPTDI